MQLFANKIFFIIHQGSTLPKSGPLSFVPSTASTPFSAQSSAGGLRMTKPTEPSASQKAEPLSKPVTSTTKTSVAGGGTSVKPPPAVQPTSSQGTPADVKKDGVVPSKETSKEKPQAKVMIDFSGAAINFF